MNIIDIGIIFISLMGVIVGFKRGAIRSLLSFLGTTVIVVLAFYLKNPLSVILYTNLPFFNFGLTALNILLYEAIAYLIVFAILSFILKLIVKVSGIIDFILNATLVFAIPSKIIGALISLLEYYVFAYIILFSFANLSIDSNLINESKYANNVLYNTPFISNINENSNKVIEEFAIINRTLKTNDKKANEEAVEVLLKYNIVKEENLKKLNDKNKFNFDLNEIILKYKDGFKND